MCQNCLVKTIHSVHSHFGWDNSFTPVERVAPGTTLEFECHDSSNGHFTKDSVVADVTSMPFDRINPVSGPVFVEGAMPGDVLKVTIDSFKPSGFGWTANIPGFGLLADQFLEPALALWQYDTESLAPAAFGDFARIPLKPFAGTIGVAPAEPGPALGGAAAARRRQPGHPRPGRRRPPCTCRWRSKVRCSPSATPTPPRATARSAARPSKAG